MLNNLRDSLQPHLEKIGKDFASTGISPNGWSCIGLVFAFVSAFIYGWNVEFSLIIGGIVLLVAGFFDIVDGQVARVSKKVTKSGGFLDSVFDKIAEVAIFLGILVGGFAEPYLVFLAITFSLLVSYTRSRAESLGVKFITFIQRIIVTTKALKEPVVVAPKKIIIKSKSSARKKLSTKKKFTRKKSSTKKKSTRKK